MSKLIRLKIGEDIAKLVAALPFEGTLRESQEGLNAYLATGTVRVGARALPVRVRVRITREGLQAEIDAAAAKLSFRHPYGTEHDRAECVGQAVEAWKRLLN